MTTAAIYADARPRRRRRRRLGGGDGRGRFDVRGGSWSSTLVVVVVVLSAVAAAAAAEAAAASNDDGGCPSSAVEECDPSSSPSSSQHWPKGDGLLVSTIRYLLRYPPDGGPPRNPLASLIIQSDFFMEHCASLPITLRIVTALNSLLAVAGVPKRNQYTTDEFVLYLSAMVTTLVAYYVGFGKRHGRRRRALEGELRRAQEQVHELEEKLLQAKAQDISSGALGTNKPRRGRGGEVRIFLEGAFDMMHYGHMNAFRLARSLGTRLVVGVNSAESITRCKGAPLMNDQERLTMVEGCKFVDEVVPGVPYVMNASYLKYVVEKFDIDYVVHGDDPCIVDGKDVYAAAKEAGKYQSIPRTEGVSTTDIVGRMLTLTKDHHCPPAPSQPPSGRKSGGGGGAAEGGGGADGGNSLSSLPPSAVDDGDDDRSVPSVITAATASEQLGGDGRPLCEKSKFLTTSRMLRHFSAGMVAPENGMRVVYMDGAWDMFHCGHVTALKEAKRRGDYLIVGVHSDAVVNRNRGGNLPLMNLHERVLSVMGCRYVDDVLIDAPYQITPDMVASLKIAEVVHGSRSDEVNRSGGGGGNGAGASAADDGADDGGLNGHVDDNDDDDAIDRHERWGDRYTYPRRVGMFTIMSSPTTFDLGSITDRIRRNQEVFQAKIAKKKKAEGEYYDERYGRSKSGKECGGNDDEGRGGKKGEQGHRN